MGDLVSVRGQKLRARDSLGMGGVGSINEEVLCKRDRDSVVRRELEGMSSLRGRSLKSQVWCRCPSLSPPPSPGSLPRVITIPGFQMPFWKLCPAYRIPEVGGNLWEIRKSGKGSLTLHGPRPDLTLTSS